MTTLHTLITTPKLLLIAYLLVINLITFVAFGVDKHRARTSRRRVRERTLWLLAASGGVWCGWLAMSVFRHKGKKGSFVAAMIGLTVFNILWLGLLVWYWPRVAETLGTLDWSAALSDRPSVI